MFAFLDDLSTDDALSTVYYSIRILKHIKQLESIEQDLIVPGLETEPSPAAVSSAKQVLSAIETRENIKLKELDKAKASEYTRILADYIQRRLEKEDKIVVSRGKSLLVNLRIEAGREHVI